MIKELMSFILLSSIIGIEFLITPTVDEESSNGLQSSAHLPSEALIQLSRLFLCLKRRKLNFFYGFPHF